MANTTRKRKESSIRRGVRKLVKGIPSMRSIARKGCPPGMIKRKSFTRKYSTAVKQRGFTVRRKNGKTYHVTPKSGEMHIESRCVKNIGSSGKSPKLFGPLRKGELAKHGYSFRRGESERRAALKKAVAEYGTTGVFHKLNAVAKLTKTASPNASKVFAADRNWVQKAID